MDGSIYLSQLGMQDLVDYYRTSADPALRLRAHILLLLAGDSSLGARLRPCCTPAPARSAGGRTVSSRKGGRGAGISARPACCFSLLVGSSGGSLGHGKDSSGLRLPAKSLVVCHGRVVAVGGTPVERQRRDDPRWLHRERLVWRRPRPVLGPKDPAYAYKLGKIRHLLATLPDDETAVFQDEVDINTNPKIGSMWMFEVGRPKWSRPAPT